MGKTIRINIDEEGHVEMDYNGFIGHACVQTHEKLLKRMNELGVKVDASATDSKPKNATLQSNKQKVSL